MTFCHLERCLAHYKNNALINNAAVRIGMNLNTRDFFVCGKKPVTENTLFDLASITKFWRWERFLLSLLKSSFFSSLTR